MVSELEAKAHAATTWEVERTVSSLNCTQLTVCMCASDCVVCVCVSSIHCQECSYSALHLTSLYTPHIVQPLLLVSVQPVYIQLLVHLSPEHLSRCWYASVYTCLIMHAALSLCGNYFLSHKWGMFDWHMPWALCMVFNYVHTLVLVSDWNVWL